MVVRTQEHGGHHGVPPGRSPAWQTPGAPGAWNPGGGGAGNHLSEPRLNRGERSRRDALFGVSGSAVKPELKKARAAGHASAPYSDYRVGLPPPSQSPPLRRACGFGTRDAGFGPSAPRRSGLHPLPPAPRPVPTGSSPPSPHARTALMSLSIVRAFIGTPNTMPSADFRVAITALAESLSPEHAGRGADLPRQDQPPAPHTRRTYHLGP